MAARVSVCIPAYNQPLALKKTLESLAVQTYRDFEVVVTDDSTTTAVERCVAEFHTLLPIRYRRNEPRRGTPTNWNEAIALAEGEYIKVLHHDDWLRDRNALGRYAALLDDAPKAVIGFSATDVCDAEGRHVRFHVPSPRVLRRLRHSPRILLTGNWIGSPSAVIVRRSAHRPYDERFKWVVDIDYYLSILSATPGVAFTQSPLVCTTSGSPAQVTAECRDNPAVEVPEWILLYVKHHAPLRWPYVRFLGRLFWRCGISGPTDLKGVWTGGNGLPPVVVAALSYARIRRRLRSFPSRPVGMQSR